MPDEKEIARLLEILRNPHLSDEDRQSALQQLMAHEADLQALLRKDFKAELPATADLQAEADQAFDRLRQQTQASQESAPVVNMPDRSFRIRRWAGVAAAVLLCLSVAWFFRQRDNKATGITKQEQQQPQQLAAQLFDTIRNPGATTLFHRLPDGSTVHLEPNSRIIYRDSLAGAKKEIYLEGAALFAVQKEEARPFAVYVNGVEVLDLGTVFSVNGKQSTVKVKLIQGKVLVRAIDPKLAMKDISLVPGQECSIDIAARHYAVHSLPAEKQERRLSKQLAFSNEPLQRVFDRLAKECNVTIQFNKTDIKDKAFTGTLDAGSDAKKLIAMVCMINDLRYELKNNAFYIHQ